jgi:hypothetical protein
VDGESALGPRGALTTAPLAICCLRQFQSRISSDLHDEARGNHKGAILSIAPLQVQAMPAIAVDALWRTGRRLRILHNGKEHDEAEHQQPWKDLFHSTCSH